MAFVRKATIEDKEAILGIYDRIFAAEERGPVICGWKRGRYPNEEVADDGINSGEMMVLVEDERVVGAARFNKVEDEIFFEANWKYAAPAEEILVLHTLTVDPDAKGRGYGKQWLAYYEELARSMGCTELRMDTGGGNVRARKIYKDMGFIEADELHVSREPGEPEHVVIFLEKHLQ